MKGLPHIRKAVDQEKTAYSIEPAWEPKRSGDSSDERGMRTSQFLLKKKKRSIGGAKARGKKFLLQEGSKVIDGTSRLPPSERKKEKQNGKPSILETSTRRKNQLHRERADEVGHLCRSEEGEWGGKRGGGVKGNSDDRQSRENKG